MEFRSLPFLAFLSLLVVVSNASVPPEVYWKLALPYTPMPKAVGDLLQPSGSLINVSKVVLNAIRGPVYIGYGKGKRSPPGAATEDQPQDTSRKGYFLEKDLHSTTKMKMHFRKTTNEATFLHRQVADSIPFSSDKLPEILNRFSLKEDSEEAEIMKETIQDCEQPALEGDSRFCATSLESLIDFSISKLGKNIKPISTEVEMGSQEYELGVAVKLVADKSVVCHKQKYPYAVFYCHAVHKTRVYTLPFVGTEDGTKAEIVASCHIDTSAWNPKHVAFQVFHRSSLFASMAFLSTPPFASTAYPAKFSLTPRFSVLGLGFRSISHGVVVRNSNQAEPLVDSTQIDDAPLLSCLEAIERLKTSQENQKSKQQYLAMYSSIFGGITTDKAAMVIPMDDHMVHRGHGVFDTAAIMDGYLYELDQHLDRFLRSASMAKINLPFDRESIRRILIQTVSASKCRKGSLRYWLSAGPGDFQLSPSGCQQSALYAIVIQDLSPFDQKGIKVVTSSVPIKTPQFATMKSVNYLPNVLSKMEAEENGSYAAIWLDDDGFIAEGPNMNVAFVTKEKELVMPHFDKILSGCTAKRVLALAEGLMREGKLQGIRVGNLSVEEGKKADEMMLIGSGVLVRSVLQWDEHVIGDGKEGPVTLALLNLILDDMKSGPPTIRVPVPY